MVRIIAVKLPKLSKRSISLYLVNTFDLNPRQMQIKIYLRTVWWLPNILALTIGIRLMVAALWAILLV